MRDVSDQEAVEIIQGRRNERLNQGRRRRTAEKRDFPGGPAVQILPSSARGVGLIPGQGSKIPHALWQKHQNLKQKQYCNEFTKTLQRKRKKCRGERHGSESAPLNDWGIQKKCQLGKRQDLIAESKQLKQGLQTQMNFKVPIPAL